MDDLLGPAPTHLRLKAVGLAAFAITAVVLLVIVGGHLGTEGSGPCATARDPQPGAWAGGDAVVRDGIARELADCRRFAGRTEAEIGQLLGPATSTAPRELRYAVPADGRAPQRTLRFTFDARGYAEATAYMQGAG